MTKWDVAFQPFQNVTDRILQISYEKVRSIVVATLHVTMKVNLEIYLFGIGIWTCTRAAHHTVDINAGTSPGIQALSPKLRNKTRCRRKYSGAEMKALYRVSTYGSYQPTPIVELRIFSHKSENSGQFENLRLRQLSEFHQQWHAQNIYPNSRMHIAVTVSWFK